MTTKKAAAKAAAPKPAQPEATEGAALLSTGGDFTPPPPTAAEMEPSKVPAVKQDDGFRPGPPPSIEAIAKVCHEANRALCAALGDDSQKPWAEAADWQRESAIKGVQFAMDNPDADPSAQHAAWCRDKLAAGWAYGPEKNEAMRQHPCLVAYDLLPVGQKAKDHIFRAIVRAMLAG